MDHQHGFSLDFSDPVAEGRASMDQHVTRFDFQSPTTHDAFSDLLSLIFCNRSPDVLLQATLWGVGIVSQGILNLHAVPLEVFFHDELLGQVTREAIYFPHCQDIELGSFGHFEYPPKLR